MEMSWLAEEGGCRVDWGQQRLPYAIPWDVIFKELNSLLTICLEATSF